ncbi:MAG: hypothetical protein M1828_001371 [Chrysothrix sp. TS-e1954]|nr:MAG: hypothetical protein M1828_001371 [Chrysothrix sp. TS-e1954]
MHLGHLLAALWIPITCAIHADEAGIADWHFALLGIPQQGTTFFHRPHAGSRASLLYTLSETGTLGAVNPRDGSIVWRQKLQSSDRSSSRAVEAVEGNNVVYSASNDTVQAWGADDGRLVWASSFSDRKVVDLSFLPGPNNADEAGGQSLFVALDGKSVGLHCLDADDGTPRWSLEDINGDIPYRLSTSPAGSYLISLHKALLKGYKLRVSKFDPTSVKTAEQISLSSDNEISGIDEVLYVGRQDHLPLLVWTDQSKSSIKVNVLGSKSVSSFDVKAHGTKVDAVTVITPAEPSSRSHFLVQYQAGDSHWAEVFHFDSKKVAVRKEYQLGKLPGRGAFTASTVDGDVYFTRVTQDEMTLFSSQSQGILSRWPIKEYGVPSLQGRPQPLHATSEVAVRSGSTYSVRSAVLLSTGDWALVRNGEPVWYRPEALADVTSARWIEDSQMKVSTADLALEAHSNPISAYAHRLARHIGDLRHLPSTLGTMPQALGRVLGAFGSSSARQVQDNAAFGLNKIIEVSTSNGRHIHIDVGNAGKVISNSADAAGTFLGPAEVRSSAGAENDTSASLTYKVTDTTLEGRTDGSELWRFTPKKQQRILSVVSHPEKEPVASIGKVLGDRSVLYKYLNENSVVVTTADDRSNTLSVYLLDSFSGSVLYTAEHKGVDLGQPVPVLLSENWLCYAYATESADEELSRGYELTVAELYESQLPNDRGPLESLAEFKSTMPNTITRRAGKPFVVSQTYETPELISDMAVTQTTQGITSRQLLVTVPALNAVIGIPRQLLDPRRPVGVDPTAMQVEEGLMRYIPALHFDPKWYLNHKEELQDVKNMMTTPTGLESTSLVFAYGHDLFGTKVSPSFAFDILGSSFNKVQLILTVVALTVGVFFVAPLVTRKQTNMLWQST